jgi:hypothetical protein
MDSFAGKLAAGQSAGSVSLSHHLCDICDEQALRGFADAALAAHGRDHEALARHRALPRIGQ